MLAVVIDLLAVFFIAKHLHSLWAQLPLAILAGIASPIVANFLAYAVAPGVISKDESALRAILGIFVHPPIALAGLWYFRYKATKLEQNKGGLVE